MTLQLKTKARLFDLHCSVGLTDWDMDKELRLATTTDQFYHDDKLNDQYVVQRPSARASRRKDEFIWYDKTSDSFVTPNLWLLVNPSIACPIRYRENTAGLQSLCEPAEEIPTPLMNPAETQRPLTTELHVFDPHGAPLQEELLPSPEYMIKNEDVSCPPAKTRRKGRNTKAQDNKILKPGCWPRPPVNYCILIALALKSSHTGSLKVQQIYNFTREHFPFFQTAPDGWKNTIRHNLCFNSSFRKTCNQVFRDGKRKSCFWHLTLDGHRRLKDEIRTLTGESLKQLERSMSRPGERDNTRVNLMHLRTSQITQFDMSTTQTTCKLRSCCYN
ncbi:forkhead box protein R1 isoform X1 [Etheostoma spectabile]|uniref:forkhead box protein R1 isoform X1 n=1 Tax=Etheostoma spectabile TaxID=54343 RepID=UPI0013AFA987|nr:forkhead box protein N5-like isoform X1 [Etheostoma spectabile]